MKYLLARLMDANFFVLELREGENGSLLAATLHPFDLDGRGYEARVYHLVRAGIQVSGEFRRSITEGWGIDDIECTGELGVILSREDHSISVNLSDSSSVEWKVCWLQDHPNIMENGVPEVLRQIAYDDSIEWKSARKPW